MTTLRIIGCLLLLAMSGGMVHAGAVDAAPPGDRAVDAGEFEWHAARLRTEVAGRLMRAHAIELSPGFWTTPLDGVTPAETLRRETLRSIARHRSIQELAVAHGLLDTVKSHRELVAAFHRENARRKEMKAAGRVFYGPVQFRQEVWFDIWFDQLERELDKRAAAPAGAESSFNP